ncbi:MAG: hypothetical protein HHJ15_13580 [Rhodoferax sp.]|nr:hypothetical protein [Rhodoferax sp.]
MRALLALNAGGKYLFPKDTKEGAPEKHAAEGTLTKTWLERQTQSSETRPGRRPIGPERKPRKTEEVGLLDLHGGHWTTHDLRRTLGTLSKRLGFDNETIDKCLHHRTGTMLQRNYIIDDDRKKMIELWHAFGDFVSRVVDSAKTDEAALSVATERAEKFAAMRAECYVKVSAKKPIADDI